MVLPARIGAAFEMVETQFAFQLLILLLDGPSLMRKGHEGSQRGARRQMDEVRLDVAIRFAFAQEPDLGVQPSSAPAGGRRHAQRGEARTTWGLCPIAPADPPPSRSRQAA